MIRAGLALAMVLIVGTSGMIYAADAAVPGDFLYGVDQTVESVRLGLTTDPDAASLLLSAYAEERLQEAGQLSATGDEENEQAALENYGDLMLTMQAGQEGLIGQEPTSTTVPTDTATVEPSASPPTGTATVEPSVTPTTTPTVEPSVTPTTTPTSTNACVGADPHPVAEKLAAQYGVSYDDIMSWFCEGHYGFGEIKLALEASEKTGIAPEDLLAMKTELGGWGQVWKELGMQAWRGNGKNKADDEATPEPEEGATPEPDDETDKPGKDKDKPGDDKDKPGDDKDKPGDDKDKPGDGKDKPGDDKDKPGDDKDKDKPDNDKDKPPKDKGGGKKGKP